VHIVFSTCNISEKVWNLFIQHRIDRNRKIIAKIFAGVFSGVIGRGRPMDQYAYAKIEYVSVRPYPSKKNTYATYILDPWIYVYLEYGLR